MAKKMLINADMLLATPRRNEPIAQPAQVATVVEEEKIEKLSAQQEPYRSLSNISSVSDTLSEVEESQMPQYFRELKKMIEVKEVKEVSSVQKGLKPGETRATFIVKEEALEKIKAMAYWDRQNIKDIVQLAIEAYIKQYENAKGAVPPMP